MDSQLVTVALNTSNLNAMVEFYNALGANLKTAKVEKGGAVYRGQLGGVELVLHSIQTATQVQVPRASFRFEVKDIRPVWAEIQANHAGQILMDLSSLPTGQSFVCLDPDGQSIEVFQNFPKSGDDEH